jgi:small subunit ribosomal protein S6
MRNYQLTLVLNASLKDAERKKLLETVKELFKGAKFSKEEEWGEKELAYKIKKQDKGFYLNYQFETDQSVVDVDKKLISNENILRYLLLRTK